MTGRVDGTVVLLDRDSDDGALCGRPARVAAGERYLLAVARPGQYSSATVALAASDVARLIAALGSWLAAATRDGEPGESTGTEGQVAA